MCTLHYNIIMHANRTHDLCMSVGSISLIPSNSASLCPGEETVVTCSTSAMFHRWIINPPNAEQQTRRIVSSASSSQAQITPVLLNSTVSLTFDVLSNQEDSQLISRLYINNVAALFLNTTTIQCLEEGMENSGMASLTLFVHGKQYLDSKCIYACL